MGINEVEQIRVKKITAEQDEECVCCRYPFDHGDTCYQDVNNECGIFCGSGCVQLMQAERYRLNS